MILIRETTPRTRRRGTVVVSRTTPSTRNRTRKSSPRGSKCTSEAPRSTASAMIELTSFTTGVVVGGFAQLDHLRGLGLLLHLVDGLFEPRELADQRHDLPTRRHRSPNLVAGAQRDVVESDEVGGVRRRDEQRAVALEGNGHGAVAAGLLCVDQVGGAAVVLEDVEVQMREAVALGKGARKGVGVDPLLLDQQLPEQPSRLAAARGRVLNILPARVSELYQYVSEAALGARRRRREREARRLYWFAPGDGHPASIGRVRL